jgi:GDP-4-dehydro-6-deoxy-D-mannose reductase
MEAQDTIRSIFKRSAGFLEGKSLALRVFVTGATGFVGKHFLDLLKKKEAEIFGFCYPDEPKPDQLTSRCKIHKIDIRSDKNIEEFIKISKPDYILHLAAVSNVGQSWGKRKETFEVNIIGTLNLLEAVRKHVSGAKILFISSSEVYGIPEEKTKLLKETDSVQPVSPYAFTKLNGERLCQFYTQIEDLDIVTARSFPHTGPGQSPDFVCSDWANQIARIEKGLSSPLIKVGNLEVKRDFLDVRDVVKAYFSLMKKGNKGQVYNVSSSQSISLKKVLNVFLESSNVEIDVEIDQSKMRKADIPVLTGDNQKIQKELSWTPKIPIKKTLLDLLQYWRDVYHS